MLGVDGEPLLADFGISARTAAGPLLAAFSCLGAPLLTAPEVLQFEDDDGEAIDHAYSDKADVWSLGASL